MGRVAKLGGWAHAEPLAAALLPLVRMFLNLANLILIKQNIGLQTEHFYWKKIMYCLVGFTLRKSNWRCNWVKKSVNYNYEGTSRLNYNYNYVKTVINYKLHNCKLQLLQLWCHYIYHHLFSHNSNILINFRAISAASFWLRHFVPSRSKLWLESASSRVIDSNLYITGLGISWSSRGPSGFQNLEFWWESLIL